MNYPLERMGAIDVLCLRSGPKQVVISLVIVSLFSDPLRGSVDLYDLNRAMDLHIPTGRNKNLVLPLHSRVIRS